MFVPAHVPPLPKLQRSEIDVMYLQMRNNGQFYIGQLGSPPISINEWREREYARLEPGRDK